jgi:hypothetical protein
LLECPVTLPFVCGKFRFIGIQNVRGITPNQEIEVRKIFTFFYAGVIYGSYEFSNVDDFIQKTTQWCVPNPIVDNCCKVTYNGCFVTYKGKVINHGMQ